MSERPLRTCCVVRNIVPGCAENANRSIRVLASHKQVVSVECRDHEDADTSRCQWCRQRRQHTGHVQVQGTSNRQRRPRGISFHIRRNARHIANHRQFRRRTRDREEGSIHDPGWKRIARRHATYRIRTSDRVEGEPGAVVCHIHAVQLGIWFTSPYSARRQKIGEELQPRSARRTLRHEDHEDCL